MKINKLVFPLIALGLANCAMGSTKAERMSAFVGQPTSVLVAQMGVPNRRMMIDGVKYFTYVEQHASYYPGSLYGTTPIYTGYGEPLVWGGFPPEYDQESCKTTFAIKGGLVRSFTLRGSDC